jgi:hypothetical protein
MRLRGEPLIASPFVRRAADAAFDRWARQQVRRLDRLSPAYVQATTLRRLVRYAAGTRFGREHRFDSVRSVADYQARVPLRDYEAFWETYWRPAFPRLRGVTWPDRIPYYALSSGTTSGSTKYLPVSRQMVASNRRAALTLLNLFRNAHPGTPLFRGRIFFLGGSTALVPQSDGSLAGDLSGIAARETGAVLRAYTFPPPDLGLMGEWDRKVRVLAERSAALPITAVSGVPAWLLTLFDTLKAVTGKDRVIDIWPTLRLVIHGGALFDPYRSVFRQVIGSDAVHFLDTYPSSEGYVATEDPRYGRLRLLLDHGVFFEFVPVEELGADRPTRHTVADLEVGANYAVALTTCAGLWSYVLGDTVTFERRNPPLLRFTGRTKYFLSAFGEHLISEEVERAVALAAEATGATVRDFHVGPVFPSESGRPGHHRYLVEFVQPPDELARFTRRLDEALSELNKDYVAYRVGDVSLAGPEVVPVRGGGFADWMKARGKFGGQNKVPRMDNSGRLTLELTRWFADHPDG